MIRAVSGLTQGPIVLGTFIVLSDISEPIPPKEDAIVMVAVKHRPKMALNMKTLMAYGLSNEISLKTHT
jgi:hypothetical protein